MPAAVRPKKGTRHVAVKQIAPFITPDTEFVVEDYDDTGIYITAEVTHTVTPDAAMTLGYGDRSAGATSAQPSNQPVVTVVQEENVTVTQQVTHRLDIDHVLSNSKPKVK